MGGTSDGRAQGLRRFGRDRRGGFGAMLALAAVPMALAVGAGLDTAHVLTARSDLQNATDEAALSLAHQPYDASAAGQTAAKTLATSWVQANFNRSDASLSSTAAITSTSQVEVKGSAKVKVFFAGLLNVSSIQVNADSVVNRSLKHVELALVLDNTGSMAEDNKIGTLKTAAGQLVDTLTSSAAGAGDANALKIGVVPFSMTVNVGAQYRTSTYKAPWLTGVSPYPNDPAVNQLGVSQDRFAGFDALGKSWGGCVEERPMPYDVLDTPPTIGKPNTFFVPYFAPDEPDDGTPSSKNAKTAGYWYNSYISDQVSANDAGNTDPAYHQAYVAKYINSTFQLGYYNAHGATPYTAGPNWGCGVTPLMRLTPVRSTTDANAIHNELNAMTPVGDTEIPVGLVWGWHVLSPYGPFGDGSAYGAANTLKIVVLVTDGANTYNQGNVNNQNQSLYTSLGYLATKRISVGGPIADGGSPTQGDFSNVAAALDDRLTKLCANMQYNNIIIYTVPVEVTDSGIKSRLQNCASGADHYIDATSTAALTAAFANIAGQISALRLAR